MECISLEFDFLYLLLLPSWPAPRISPFVQEGRSVFCKHVVWCGKNVRVAADTPILFENRVIAVGRAILSSEMISDFKRSKDC